MTDEGWDARWRALPAGLVPHRLLVQGRAIARSQRVGDLRIDPGRVSARVQGSRATAHLVEVSIPLLGDDAWAVLVDLVARQVRHSAQLLAARSPEGLAEEAGAAGVALFPTATELTSLCGGGDGLPSGPAAGWCAHAGALWEAAADALAADAFVLLRARGRGRERFLRDVAARRRARAGTEPRPGIAIEDLTTDGWTAERAPLDDLGLPDGTPPRPPAAPLRLLGDPPGWEGAVSAWELFAPTIKRAAEHASLLEEASDGR